MSIYSTSIVPRVSNYPEHTSKAQEILKWLVEQDIVKSTLSDCVLDSHGGYAVSEGAKKVVLYPEELPWELVTNGLDIITQRTVFDTCGNGLDELTCPSCKTNLVDSDWDFFLDWYEEKSNDITCPACNVAAEVHLFQFSPAWGFSNLGFTFWNWGYLKDDFIKQMQERLGCEVDVVYCRH